MYGNNFRIKNRKMIDITLSKWGMSLGFLAHQNIYNDIDFRCGSPQKSKWVQNSN